MAERRPGPRLDQGTFNCPICLDLMKEPVTIPCGHSYCMRCVSTHWDGEVSRESCSCPQCRRSFRRRPVLVKNTVLAAAVEELCEKAPPSEADHGDVCCDLCSGRKVKAVKSCLQCLVSYCEVHLQPHYDVAALKKHKLVEPTENLQENVCSRHDEVMKMFCYTDQQCICYLCSVDQHKGHHTGLAAEKRHEMQRELEDSMKTVRQRIQVKQEHMDALQRHVDSTVRSGTSAVMETDWVFIQIARLVERRRTQVKQQIRSQQEQEERRVKEQQDQLQQEITDLRRRYTGLETLALSENHCDFILSFPSLSKLSEASDQSLCETVPLTFSDVLPAAVAELRDALQDISVLDKAAAEEEHPGVPSSEDLREWLVLSHLNFSGLHVPPAGPVLRCRAELLAHAHRFTLDPNTVHSLLSLSADCNTVRFMNDAQEHPAHPHRFTSFSQVLTREPLTGRCYLEVKGRCEDYFSVAVVYSDIRRAGPYDECSFGSNTRSWALDCYSDEFVFWFNKSSLTLSAPSSNKVGIYVDYEAGLLGFYSVSQEARLIHSVKTTFTGRLLAGIWLKEMADCAEVCSLG